MSYKVTKASQEAPPKVYIEWIEGYEVEAVQLRTGETYYLSISNELQKANYKRVDTGKVMYVNYCGERKLMSLYKLEKVI